MKFRVPFRFQWRFFSVPILLLLGWQPALSQSGSSSCNTWTFQLRIGSSRAEKSTNVLQLPTGSYIICGNDSSAAGKRGRLLKMSPDGQILTSKELAYGSRDFVFERLRFFSDGKLYGIGTGADPSSGALRPILLTVDTTSLAVVTSTLFQPVAGTDDWKAADVGQGADSTVFLYLYSDSLVNITKLGAQLNTVLWSKTYRPRNKPQPVGMGVEFADVYFAWNETDSGYAKAVIASVDFTTGNYKYGSRTGGSADGSQVRLQSFALRSLRPRVTALQYKNGQYQTVRLFYQYDCSLPFTETFASGGYTADAGTLSQQNASEEGIAVQAAASPATINLIHTYPENFRDPIDGWRLQYPVPVELASLCATNDGGHFLLSTTTTQPRQLIVTKTDSIATLPGCQSTKVPTTFSRDAIPYKMDVLPLVSAPLQRIPVILQSTDLAVTVAVDCKSLYCPSPPQPDSCLRTFFKEYRSYTNTVGFNQALKLDNGRFLTGGSSQLMPLTANSGPLFNLLDTNGRILDSRMLTGPDRIYPQKIIRLRDGNVLLVGLLGLTQTGNPYIVKIDQQLNILWQKQINSSLGYDGIDAVIESAEGDIYCYLHDRFSFREIRTILKLDAGANPVWMRQYDIGPSIFGSSGESKPALTELGDGIVIKYNEETADFSPMLMRLRKSDGSIDWVRRYQMDAPFGGSNSFSLWSLVADGNNIFMSGISQARNLILKIASDGSVELAKRTPVGSYSDQYRWMGFGSNGNLLVSDWVPKVGLSYCGIFELDKNLVLLRKQFLQMPRYGVVEYLLPYSDSVVFAAGSLYQGDAPWLSAAFLKYNFNSSFARCAVADVPVILEAYTQPSIAKTVSSMVLPLPQLVPYLASYLNVPIAYSNYHCGNNSACTSLALQGPTLICDSSNAVDFRSNRNAGCEAKVIWLPDTTAGQITVISATDSLLRIKLKRSGSFVLRSKLFANCGWLQDSLVVQASFVNSSLNLGKDTTLCSGNSIILHAGSGFASYLWQDGSTDSIYTVTQPGLYFVDVVLCGNHLRDSVIVGPPLIPFSIGPDRTKCNQDTLRFNAPSGFLNYTWSPQYNLSSTNSASVVVNPLVDTTYYVKAEKTPGCFVYDTIHVQVYHSPAIDLGSDVSFCTGDSVTLDAGTGFSSYSWNGLSGGQTNTVRSAGTYSVVGTADDGCKSFDTLRILNVWPLPSVSLDKNTALCLGDIRTLTAGSFSSYLWQNGSTASAYTVTGIGTYWVRVTDAHNCVGSDTTFVTTILPLPGGFLPQDTAICSYGTLTLKPLQSFVSYLWSSGGTQSTLTVDKPGEYWLKVVNQNGCSGRDTITVKPKQCMSGVYVPSAFSPNHDGKNDAFKAMVFGQVKKFELTVYNRWGQVIFQATDPGKGWDGTVGGVAQRSDAFVWICRYQLEGGPETLEKGTVTLVR